MLSHGDDRDIIYGADQAFSIAALTEPFKRSTNSLLGKPKIFIFQVSRIVPFLEENSLKIVVGMSWSKSDDFTSENPHERQHGND